jgi:hypothetical protein
MLLGFKRQFAPRVEDGRKTHTIRAKRKRRPRPGETCHCYVDPRQKTMRLLGRWACRRVEDIEFRVSDTCEVSVWVDGQPLDEDQRECLARADGFSDFAAMMQFWKGRLPFAGDLIHWHYRSDWKTIWASRKRRRR